MDEKTAGKIEDIKLFTDNVLRDMMGEPLKKEEPPKEQAQPAPTPAEEKKPEETPTPAPAAEPKEEKKAEAATAAPANADASTAKPDPENELPTEIKEVPTPAPAITKLDPEQIQELAKSFKAETTATALAPTAQGPDVAGLSEREKKNLEVFKRMEETDPKYKGVSSRFVTFSNQLRTYKAEWQRKNPSKKWNQEDEEHTEYVESISPDFDPQDFDDARIDMRAEQIAAQKSERLREELESTTAKKELPALIDEKFSIAANTIAKEVGPELIDKIKTKEGREALQKEDPYAVEQVDGVMRELRNISEEAAKLGDPRLRTEFNPGNPAHALLRETFMKMDKAISSNPSAKLHEGRIYAAPWEYSQLTPQQQASRWTFTPDDVMHVVAKVKAGEAKARIEKFHSYIESATKSKMASQAQSVSPATQTPHVKPETKPSVSSDKPSAPSTATAGDITKNPSSSSSFAQIIADGFARDAG